MSVIIKKKDPIQEEALLKFKRQKYILMLDSKEEDKNNLENAHAQKMYKLIKSLPDTKLILEDTLNQIEKHFMHPKTVLFIINFDLIDDVPKLMTFFNDLKTRKNMPFLFVSSHPEQLVTAYRQFLFIYQEADDFIPTPINIKVLEQKLKRAISGLYRKAKRFDIKDDVWYTFPTKSEEKLNISVLMDISLSGFYIQTKEEIFSVDQQVQLHVPISKYLSLDLRYGELLKVAGVVKRVNISGNEAGCEIVHLSATQRLILTQLVTKIYSEIKLRQAQKKLTPEALQKIAEEKAKNKTSDPNQEPKKKRKISPAQAARL